MPFQNRVKRRLLELKSNPTKNLLGIILTVLTIAAVLTIASIAFAFYISSVLLMTGDIGTPSHWGLTTSLIFGFSFYAAIGVMIALINRNHATKKTQGRGFIGILLNDYDFTESASLRLITLEYAIAQGVLVGIALAAVPCAVKAGVYFKYIGHQLLHPGWLFLYGVIALLILAIIRIILEASALKIRERESAIKYYIAARDRITNGGHQDPGIRL